MEKKRKIFLAVNSTTRNFFRLKCVCAREKQKDTGDSDKLQVFLIIE